MEQNSISSNHPPSFIGRKHKAENNIKSLLQTSDIDISTTVEKVFNCEWGVTLSSPDAGQNREEKIVNKLFECAGCPRS